MKKAIIVSLLTFSLMFQSNVKSNPEIAINPIEISGVTQDTTDVFDQVQNVSLSPGKAKILGRLMLMPWTKVGKILKNFYLCTKALKNGEYKLCAKGLKNTLISSAFTFWTISALFTKGMYVPNDISFKSFIWILILYPGYLNNIINNISMIKNTLYQGFGSIEVIPTPGVVIKEKDTENEISTLTPKIATAAG